MKFRVSDAIAILFSAFVAMSALFFVRRKSSSLLYVNIVSPAGSFVYPADRDALYSFEGDVGRFTIVVKDGAARVVETHCRSGSCALRSVSSSGETIVCLPNRITVSIVGGDGFDSVSY